MKILTTGEIKVIYENENATTKKELVQAALDAGITDFTRADFAGYDLSDLVFRNCVFSRATFDTTKLSRTHFVNCYMDDATFRNANIYDTYFDQCNMDEAHFEKTHMGWAAMGGCLLRGANLVDLGMTARGYRVIMTYEDGKAIIRGGCREMDLDQARRIYPESNNDEEGARVTLARRIAHQRGWLKTELEQKLEAAFEKPQEELSEELKKEVGEGLNAEVHSMS